MMIKNFLLLFGVSIFGLMCADRTAKHSDLNRITGIQSAQTLLSFLGIGFEAIIFVLFPAHFFWALLVPPVFIFLIFCTKKIVLERRNSQFRSEFERFLDIAILEMRTGCSYRLAVEKASARSHCSFFKERTQILLQIMTYAAHDQAGQLPKNVAGLFRRMIEIDSFSHRQIHRLVTFRQQLRLESEFRHKSGQAIRQARAQAWIMIGLYFALLLFVLGRFEFQNVSHMIGLSVTLMGSGVMLMRGIGKKKKWKV